MITQYNQQNRIHVPRSLHVLFYSSADSLGQPSAPALNSATVAPWRPSDSLFMKACSTGPLAGVDTVMGERHVDGLEHLRAVHTDTGVVTQLQHLSPRRIYPCR